MPIAPADANGEKRGVERKADGGRAPVWKEGHGPVVHLQDEAADVVRLIFVFFNLYAKKSVPACVYLHARKRLQRWPPA